MSALRLILGDQLSRSISSLVGADKSSDVVLMAEVMEEASYVKHHKKKIAFLFAAMRHFAESLKAEGFDVRYVKLDGADNSGSLGGEVERALRETGADRIVVTEPGELRLGREMRGWKTRFDTAVEIRGDDRFLCGHREFRDWAEGRKQLRMEFFYRDIRRKTGLLMEDDGEPAGGQWNYDKDNRKPPKEGLRFPQRIAHQKSPITREVLDLVSERFDDHFGDLEPFHYAVTQNEAMIELDHFIETCLPRFGDYQDAMVAGEPYLYHSLISSYLNAGLLTPMEICEKAEAAYRAGHAPLNAVEGFIRQIIGWREYVRGIYWLHMPDYAKRNHLEAKEPLPRFYWSGETRMRCMAEAIGHSRKHAYSHHIQRLMITGNFALLAGLLPSEVCEWYLAVYSDAYEWVELPNTLGMALYGDGGLMASKPYAASGAYINRMSDYCSGCAYDPKEALGDKACPFNALYWDFLARNQKQLKANPRMAMPYRNLERFSDDRRKALRAKAKETLESMRAGRL